MKHFVTATGRSGVELTFGELPDVYGGACELAAVAWDRMAGVRWLGECESIVFRIAESANRANPDAKPHLYAVCLQRPPLFPIERVLSWSWKLKIWITATWHPHGYGDALMLERGRIGYPAGVQVWSNAGGDKFERDFAYAHYMTGEPLAEIRAALRAHGSKRYRADCADCVRARAEERRRETVGYANALQQMSDNLVIEVKTASVIPQAAVARKRKKARKKNRK